MKLAGLLLLFAGWTIAAFAVGLLPAIPSRSGFVLAGLATELVGLGLLVRSHMVLEANKE